MMITEMIVIVVEVRFAIIQLAVIRGYLHFLLRFFTVSVTAIFTLFTRTNYLLMSKIFTLTTRRNYSIISKYTGFL